MTDTPETLYHYTTQRGFLGIVSSGSMWASSIQHLNDPSEFLYASKLAEQAFNETTHAKGKGKDIWSPVSSLQYQWDVFVVSFSEDGNELSQWRAYGHSGGFSIGFDVAALKKCISFPSNIPTNPAIFDSGYVLEKCNYKESVSKEVIKAIVEAAMAKEPFEPADIFEFLKQFLSLAPKLKHPAFSAEKEWRLIRVRQNPFSIEENHTDICYRPGKSFFVPYIKFALTFSSDLEEPLLPVNKVWVGPTPSPELSVWNVRNILKTRGVRLAGTKVENTSIPYRDW